MTSLRTALLFVALWLLLLGMGQGLENYAAMQGGFQRELPKTICSPITGREIPVCLWDRYETKKDVRHE